MFTYLIKFIRLIGSETEPLQISMAFALALFFCFTPVLSVHNILVVLFVLMFRVNIMAFVFAWLVFSGFAYFLDPLLNQFGQFILTYPSLEPTWTELYNSSWWRITRFNNTQVMGGFAAALLAFVPVVLLFNSLIKRYRKHVVAYIKKSRLYNFLQNSKWFARVIRFSE